MGLPDSGVKAGLDILAFVVSVDLGSHTNVSKSYGKVFMQNPTLLALCATQEWRGAGVLEAAHARRNICQYIAGEPTGDDNCKCGRPVRKGGVYCLDHHVICWIPKMVTRAA